MRDLQTRLSEHYDLGDWTQQRGDLAFVTVTRARLRGVLHHLRENEGFTHLVLLTAVDWLEDGRFQLTYLLSNRTAAMDLGVRVMIPRDGAEMDSIHDLWPTAATYQRELREMFGIAFPGSPRVDEEFILEGWLGPPPYRRDFDTLKFSQDEFAERPGRESQDPAQHMKCKLYPDGDR
jgi:NADH-quinone oxidoreductase subunit C